MKKLLSLVLTLLMLTMISIPTMAEEVPSGERDTAPGVIQHPDPDGNPADAILYKAEGGVRGLQVGEGVFSGSDLALTGAGNAVYGSNLHAAVNLAKGLSSTAELGSSLGSAMQAQNSTDASNWQIIEVLEIIPSSEVAQELAQGGSIVMNLNVGAGRNNAVVAMVGDTSDVPLAAPGGWTAMKTVNNGDGSITVTFTKLGQIIIVEDTSILPNLTGATVQSPQTGSADSVGIYLIFAGLVLAAACVLYKTKRA